ncbi:hypothetical protein QAD02_019105, partial [Eretmocerus hayati]
IDVHLQQLSNPQGGVTVLTIGKSFEGRDIKCIKISNGGPNNPVLLIEGGTHAREWISPTTALYAAQQFIKDRWHSNGIDIYIIPLLNPDGYLYSRTVKRMWRKNRSNNRRSMCKGVDLNRNFDFVWNHSSQSSNPCAETYAGSGPFSEKETQAFRNLISQLRNRIRVHVTLHSPLSTIMYPWGIGRNRPGNNQTLSCLAQRAAAAVASYRNNQYSRGNIQQVV